MSAKYYRLLKRSGNFIRNDVVDVTFTYDFDDPLLAELEVKWGLRKIAGEGDTQSRALNLLHWLCMHTRHGNPQSLPEGLRMDAQSLLDWSYDQPGNDPNGKHLSIVFSECMLAVGIRAYALWCYPKVFKGEKACVVQAWLPEEDRWIMLDPSFHVYFIDETGWIFSASEVRERLGSSAVLRLNPEGQGVADWYADSMAKNMYYFSRMRDMRYGAMQEGVHWVYLCPVGYDLQDEESPVYATYDRFWK